MSDQAVNTNTTPGDDVLRVSVETESFSAGPVTLNAQLFAGNTLLGNQQRSFQWTLGRHTVDLDFPGDVIFNQRLDGPYTVQLSLQDAYYSENSRHTTAAYFYSQFQPSAAFFSGNAEDQGVDSNGNGRFEELTVSVRAAALVAGTYSLRGYLRDGEGNLLGSNTQQVTLDATRTPVPSTLHFNGVAISRARAAGPYQVTLSLINTAGKTVAGLKHTTRAYALKDFEAPAGQLTRQFTDEGLDLDKDSLYDVLRARVGVEAAAGTYVLEATLEDANGQSVTSAQTSVSLAAGAHTVSLDFPGAAIRTHGVDGPYRLTNLTLKDNADNLLDSLFEAHDPALPGPPVSVLRTSAARQLVRPRRGHQWRWSE
ncbi:hypothetical protein ACN28S_18760 [Cystobacter fuscus]